MTGHARAILWAQFRSWANYFPRSNRATAAFGIALTVVWYALWVGFSILVYKVFSEPGNGRLASTALPPGLLFVFLYWQLAPVLLAATGVSLELKKLQVYPIPVAQLFSIELLLRITSSFEMFLILGGLGAGLLANPDLPKWAALGLAPFVVFNLSLSAGTREILVRVMARKRLREIAVLLLVSIGAIPQLIFMTGAWERLRPWFQGGSSPWWPWSAVAYLAQGRPDPIAVAALLGWASAAYVFGRWQFDKSLRFDAAESNATRLRLERATKPGLWDRFARWPSWVFADPLAAIVEKELRFLSRAPRFRLVFTMGFTFGLVIWLPMTFGRHSSTTGFMARNYLTMVCAYAVLLLGDVCFWNIFGFDRSAAQAYWAMPVKFSTVLVAKNVTAFFFVLLEVTLIVLACTALRLPMSGARVAEAYAVTVVISTYLVGLGNITSTSAPRALNPTKTMRSGSAGRLQAMLFLVYPLAAIPIFLAYGARYAFRSEAAFFLALLVSVLVGAAVYWVALESAVATASERRERIITALSEGEGLIQG